MPELGAESKSPKTPRRVRTPGVDSSTRQVHFETTTAGEVAKAAAKLNNLAGKTPDSQANAPAQASPTASSQPTSYPALGPPPGLHSGQWFSSTNASQSVSFPQQQQQPQNAGYQVVLTPQLTQPTTYAHTNPQPATYFYPATQQNYQVKPNSAMAANYQNAGPPPMGFNFQPPVPDNSMGPMNHVFIPRFDGGIVPAGGVPQQGVNAMPAQQPAYIVQQQPGYVQQPVMINGQPAMMAPGPQLQPTFIPAGQPVLGAQPPIIAGNTGPVSDISGFGRTQGEEVLRQVQFAYQNRLFEPQDFKPADDDPSRFYYVRELDGNWTQRNRFSIDHMGDCRWYVTDEGWFYAVRLPN